MTFHYSPEFASNLHSIYEASKMLTDIETVKHTNIIREVTPAAYLLSI